jgi:hypothetical protein
MSTPGFIPQRQLLMVKVLMPASRRIRAVTSTGAQLGVIFGITGIVSAFCNSRRTLLNFSGKLTRTGYMSSSTASAPAS